MSKIVVDCNRIFATMRQESTKTNFYMTAKLFMVYVS